jgi:CBS domain-containing protein
MDCAAIMTPNPLTLAEDDSVATACEKLVDSHHASLPVVDAQGRYVGMFGIYDLLGLVVPRVALAGNLVANLRFIGDDPDDLRRKFRDVKHRRVGDVADRNLPALNPDTPEIEAIRLFGRGQVALAVIARDSGKVVGIVSSREAIRALTREPAPALT